MSNAGVKISIPGESVYTTDIRKLLFHSDYPMFKYHSNTTTTATLDAGETEASATVAHSLGYVPAFLVYYKRSDESVERLIPDIPYAVDFDFYPWAYATTTGVIVGYSSADPYNEYVIPTFSTCYTGMAGGTNSFTGFGKLSDGGTYDGGFSYHDVILNQGQSIVSAFLDYTCSDGDDPPGNDTKVITYGIDRDNCPDFGSDMGYDRTTASTAQNVAVLSDGTVFGINVTGQVQEILNRAGWASGNDMGFYTFDNGTSTSDLPTYKSTYGGNLIKLKVVKSGSLTISFRVIIFKDRLI